MTLLASLRNVVNIVLRLIWIDFYSENMYRLLCVYTGDDKAQYIFLYLQSLESHTESTKRFFFCAFVIVLTSSYWLK